MNKYINTANGIPITKNKSTQYSNTLTKPFVS